LEQCKASRIGRNPGCDLILFAEMSDQFKRLLMLLGISALALAAIAWLYNDYLHARRFVRYGVEKQATIVDLDHIIGGKSPKYVYSLQIDHTLILKTFPYNWTTPINRSFLVMSDSPGPDDIALGNQTSSALVVMCYMEGCDKPGNLLLFCLASILCMVALPFFWIRFLRTGSFPELP
jgi:hypothetical protein